MRLAVLLLIVAPALAEDRAALAQRFSAAERVAFKHYNEKDYEKAIAAFDEQIGIYAANARPYYNIACCYALQGDANHAAMWLRLSIRHGWRDLAHVQKDTDFDAVRSGDPFQQAVALLVETKANDPVLLPQPQLPRDAAGAQSVQAILAAMTVRQDRLQQEIALLLDHEIRRRVFAIQDQAMGRLSRYLIENGDARDAGLGAFSRVQLAMRYLTRAQPEERPLRRFAAELVRMTSTAFLRSWPGSPHLPDVLLWRGIAHRELGLNKRARRLLQTVIADHPASPTAALAKTQLAALPGS